MKQTLLLALTILLSSAIIAQSLTPTVIATAGFGFTSADLQVDMTVGETFINTLQTTDVMLTQGFHQPAEQQQGGGCVDSSLIIPDFICGDVFDPVCGCDGVTYSNNCQAQFGAGVTSWTPGECGGGGTLLGCTMPDACNYDMTATVDNGSCYFVGDPCDDGLAETSNDMYAADCMCVGEVVLGEGCTMPDACNYDMTATVDNGSCYFVGDACDDGLAETSGDMIGVDCMCVGQVVMTMGCTMPDACNYDANAAADDGSCYFVGDACDDGNPASTGDVYNSSCVCEGVVSVEEFASEISLYPNPTSSDVFITIGGVAPADVTVFDATGRFVMHVQRTSHIDIQSLAAGAYTFRVLHDGALWQKQVIKL